MIVDHPYRPDRQGQWVTGRCDSCGEPRDAHAPRVDHDHEWVDVSTLADPERRERCLVTGCDAERWEQR